MAPKCWALTWSSSAAGMKLRYFMDARLADGFVEGENLICGLHNWNYRYDTGVSEYNPAEPLYKFTSLIEEGKVWIEEEEVCEFEVNAVLPPFDEDEYLGKYADTHPEATEPYTKYIKHLAHHGFSKWGHHGQTQAMDVDRNTLPKWEHIQILPAQLHSKPLFDEDEVEMKTLIGPRVPRHLDLRGAEGVSLIVTEGLRVAEDFIKALALGTDAIAIANSAMQAIGCLGMRACHTDNCQVGIASMKHHFRQRLEIQKSAKQLHNFFEASNELMAVLARACGHEKIGDFTWEDLGT